jgi:hypothetical protein
LEAALPNLPLHRMAAPAGIGPEWRNLPGTILGLFAGVLSFRAFARDSKKKDDKPVNPSPATAPRNSAESTEG